MPATRTGLYLSLVTPPEGASEDELARALAGAGLSDAPTVRQVLMRVPPNIIGECERDVADRCAALIREMGGDAVTVPMSMIERLGGSLRVRNITIHEGALELTLWRGPAATIPTKNIDVFVRASDSREELTRGNTLSRTQASRAVAMSGPGHRMVRFAVESQAPERKLTTNDWLDIHTRDGLVYQVDGDKFGFEVLGDMKTQGDRINMNRLLDLLSHVTPEAVVDTYFPLFRAPSSVERLKLPGMTINEEDPRFAFYSRWAALIYRYVISG